MSQDTATSVCFGLVGCFVGAAVAQTFLPAAWPVLVGVAVGVIVMLLTAVVLDRARRRDRW